MKKILFILFYVVCLSLNSTNLKKIIDVNNGWSLFFISKDNNKESIRIFLKYDYNNNPVIEEIKRVSKPGLRVYVGANEAPRVLDGLGISILSTSKGVVSNKKANLLGVGGELICEVF